MELSGNWGGALHVPIRKNPPSLKLLTNRPRLAAISRSTVKLPPLATPSALMKQSLFSFTLTRLVRVFTKAASAFAVSAMVFAFVAML